MIMRILTTIFLLSTIEVASAANEKLIEALHRMEQTLTTENRTPVIPHVQWERLKKFQEKLYFTVAHDPTGIPVADVPHALRSTALTNDLMSDWTQLVNEAEVYRIDDTVAEWGAFKSLFLNIVELRNQYLFNQSRKSLKSGALTRSIDGLARYWSRRWYQENPQFTVNYDAQQIALLRKLIVEAREEVSKAARLPASVPEKSQFSFVPMVLIVMISSFVFYLLGSSTEKRKVSVEKKSEPTIATPFAGLPEAFDYEAWIQEFSAGIEALVQERESRLGKSTECSEVANTLREIRVGFMMATTETEFRDQVQKFSGVGFRLETLLGQMSGRQESDAFEHVMKTVIRLCVVLEKKQINELKIAA